MKVGVGVGVDGFEGAGVGFVSEGLSYPFLHNEIQIYRLIVNSSKTHEKHLLNCIEDGLLRKLFFTDLGT